MSDKLVKTRIKQKRASSAEWTALDPVLLYGEFTIVDTNSGDVRFKVGDGTSKYSQLPFTDELVRSQVSSHVHDDRYYTETEIDTKLTSKSDTTHKHDDLYDELGAASAVESTLNGTINAHTTNTDVHVTTSNKTAWNAAKTHADSAHAPSNAQPNQNAFSNIKVGDTTIAADTTTDTLTLVAGDNVTITPDATNDKVTITATDTVYTHPTYTSKTSGLYKITVDGTGHVSGTTAVTKSDITGLGIPAQDTTYTLPAAGNDLGGVKSGGDVTISNGIVTVNDDSHNHTIENVDGLQDALDGKADSSHGTHVTYSTTAPVMDGTASVGSASAVARSDHKHPTDTSRAAASDLTSHTGNTSNPHGVTKSQVGLGDVENKSSATIREEITSSNVTTALGYTPLNSNLKGAASGLAELDSSGKVPSSQLPSYVDDTIEGTYVSTTSFKNTSDTVITGETGKIYVDTTTNKTYRWSGSAYVEISASLALGETSSTAYRGDRGKTAYDHSQAAHAPSNAEKNQNAFSNIAVSGQTTVAADTTTDTLTLVAGSNVTITTDATNDKVTISATDTVYTHPESHAASMITGLATVATSGKYSDLSGLPTIPAAYTHPTHTAKSSGLYKITVDGSGHVSEATAVAKSDITALGIPAQDTTYTLSSFGITATATELNYTDGVTSNIQTQLNAKVPTSRTVNGKALSGNITLSASDVSAYTKTEVDSLVSGAKVTWQTF